MGFFLAVGIVCAVGIIFVRAAAPMKIIPLRIGKTSFFVEVADTPLARMKGLSGHKPLASREGMLFIFNAPSKYSFWMKGMLFPLDLVWIHEGAVIGITENTRPMSETGYKVYTSRSPVNWVLEVNAGTIKKFGIQVGDAVR